MRGDAKACWRPYVTSMERSAIIAVVLSTFVSTLALAQIAPPPPLENRIPAPLPPPAPPPIVNGPLGQSPPPGVYQPRRLNTHSDRSLRCRHEGASYGLRGGRLDRYVRDCVND